VYDRSKLCDWNWIADLTTKPPTTLVNIHSGFDESSDTLRSLFPNAKLRVLDIFDQAEMSEPSIARARKLSPSRITPEPAKFRELDCASESVDLVTLLLAAHEIRGVEPRRAFFSELRRILAPGGRIILAEHLRNLPNFIAFGPGFLHFHSHRTWLSSIESAGLCVEKELSITPFVRIFVIGSKP
jgi:SAM-dependent methyltransferase